MQCSLDLQLDAVTTNGWLTLAIDRLWHSRRLASPEIYSELTPEERNAKPPSYHKLVQKGPSGNETFFLAAHAKRLFGDDGVALEESQKKIWDLINHCTQPKVVDYDSDPIYDPVLTETP